MKDFEEVVFDTLDYWRGKENNPLNGKTFNEIYELSITVGKENIK